MFIKKLDFLSPPVTFYHHGSLSHSSIVSGIISVISIIIIVILGIYFFLNIIKRNNPNAFYYNTFVQDAGVFPLNSSSLFHFISLSTIYSNYLNDGVDFTYFRIVGFDIYFESYIKDKNLSEYDHWLYGQCNNETDTQGISHLINFDYFEKSACIKKYFDCNDKKYYDVGNPKFRWPIISNGTYNSNYTFYNFVIEKCQEDTLNLILGDNYHCKNSTEIDELVTNVVVAYIHFINHYIDVLNYKNPNTKFIFKIEQTLNTKEYTENHLNFNPSKFKTDNGLIFEHIEEETICIYNSNDVKKGNNNGNGIYSIYIFWLKNIMSYYERSYKRIQDVISSIGGINQVITIISVYINSFYNNYIVIRDTENLLFSSIDSEKYRRNKRDYKNLKNKIKEIENTGDDFIKNNSDRKRFNTEKLNNNNKNENNVSKSNNVCITDYINNNSKKEIDKNENKNIKEERKNINNKNKEKKYFCKFLLFKLFCKREDNPYKVYNDFRIKIISEEHLIRNHLNIYNLLRVVQRKRHFQRNSYKLKDLIKLV